MALSPSEAIAQDPGITVREYVAANLRGNVHRELDAWDQIKDEKLVDVLGSAEPKTRKLLTVGRFRKED